MDTTNNNSEPNIETDPGTLRLFGREIPVWFLGKVVVSIVLAVHFLKVANLIPISSLFDGKTMLSGYHSTPMASNKWTVFLSFFAIPFLLLGAARSFGFDRKMALVALALATAGFANFDFRSLETITFGGGNFLVGNYLVLFAIGALYKGGTSKRLGIKQGALILFALGLALIGSLFWTPPAVFGPENFETLLKEYVGLGGDSTGIGDAIARLFVVGAFAWGVVKLFAHCDSQAWLFLIWFASLLIGGLFHAQIPWLAGTSSAQWIIAMTPVLIFPAAFALSSFFVRPGTIRLVILIAVLWFQLTAPIAPGAPSIALPQEQVR